jgi:ribosome-binding protein aMBF1 (putative translation factor)
MRTIELHIATWPVQLKATSGLRHDLVRLASEAKPTAYPTLGYSQSGFSVTAAMASHINKNPHDPTRERFRHLLRDLRERAKLRQVDVAKRLGKPQSFVAKYEAGERRLDFIDTREVCRALGISLVQFSGLLERELSKVRKAGR